MDAPSEERIRLLDCACGTDDELKAAVQQLVQADAAPDAFVDGDVQAAARRLHGRRHPSVADDLLNLGAIESARERHTEAGRYYREALAIMREWYGEDHPQTA